VALFILGNDKEERWPFILESVDSLPPAAKGVLSDSLDPVEDAGYIQDLLAADPILVQNYPTVDGVVDAIIDGALNASDENRRMSFVLALGMYGASYPEFRNDPRIMDALYSILDELDEFHRVFILDQISYHGYSDETRSLLLDVYQSDESISVRTKALFWLIVLSEPDTGRQLLFDNLERGNGYAEMAIAAARDVEHHPEIVDRLSGFLSDMENNGPDWLMQRNILKVLRSYGADAGAAVPAVIELIESNVDTDSAEDSYNLVYGIYTLASIGEAASEAVPLMVSFLDQAIADDGTVLVGPDDSRYSTAIASLNAIGLISQEDDELLLRLRDIARNTSGTLQWAAINAIANMDETGEEAVPILQEMLTGNQDPAADTLIRFRLYRYGVDEEDNFDYIVRTFDQTDDEALGIAAWTVSYLDDKSDYFIPRLREMALRLGPGTFSTAMAGTSLSLILGYYEQTFSEPIIPDSIYNFPDYPNHLPPVPNPIWELEF